jgi:hypothetical protein
VSPAEAADRRACGSGAAAAGRRRGRASGPWGSTSGRGYVSGQTVQKILWAVRLSDIVVNCTTAAVPMRWVVYTAIQDKRAKQRITYMWDDENLWLLVPLPKSNDGPSTTSSSSSSDKTPTT